jgi:hypothetical protein
MIAGMVLNIQESHIPASVRTPTEVPDIQHCFMGKATRKSDVLTFDQQNYPERKQKRQEDES